MLISDGMREIYGDGANNITDQQIVRNIIEKQYPDMKYSTLNVLVNRMMAMGDTFTLVLANETLKHVDPSPFIW
jgi:N-acetylglucosamine kinase-like BadF-type ATPase